MQKKYKYKEVSLQNLASSPQRQFPIQVHTTDCEGIMETLFTYAKKPVPAFPQVQGFMHEVAEELSRETVIQLLGILTVLASLSSMSRISPSSHEYSSTNPSIISSLFIV